VHLVHRLLIASVAHLVGATALLARPWVPPRGECAVSVTYQNYYVTGHFDPLGNENKNGATHSKAVVMEVDYGLTDTIALTVSLPFIASKYTGPPVYFVGGHPTYPGPLDDGTYHGAFQDLNLEVRRMFVTGPIAVAPFAAYTQPSHEYETHGEAVPGRYRRDLHLGASAGASLDRLLPRTYAHVRYAFSTAEQVHDFPSVRSNIDLEGGHDLTTRLNVRGLAA
jgi:hypothetical protein